MQFDKDTKKKLIEELDIYRLENRLTLDELAKLLSVNISSISRWLVKGQTPNKVQSYQIFKLLKGFTPSSEIKQK